MQTPPRRFLTAGTWLGAAALLVVFRLHAFELPLETDEANYAYIGGRLLAGDRLYLDVWDHQPPGVYVLFAAVMALCGDAPQVFRGLALVFSLLSLLWIFLIVQRLAGRGWGHAAALLFALVSSDPGTAGEGCNREIYMNTLLLAGWYAALRGVRQQHHGGAWIAASGAALALASLLKTLVAIHWAAIAVWLIAAARDRDDNRHRAASIVLLLARFAAAPLILWMAVFAYFAATQRLDAMTDAVFGFNLAYSRGEGSFWSRFLLFFNPGEKPFLQPFVFVSARPLWIVAAGGTALLIALCAVRRGRGADESVVSDGTGLALLMLGASYLATCMPAQFWPHYYYLMLPPAVAIAVLAMRAASGLLTAGAARRGAAAAGVLLLAGAVLHGQVRHYLAQPPFGITVIRYNGRDYWGRAQGENVQQVTDPDDEIFVYGADAGIYYYAHRAGASRYTMLTALRSGYPGHEERRAIMLREIIERRPRLILVVLGEETFPAWTEFLPTRYDAIGWDFRDRPPHDPILMVLGDRARPVEPIDWDWDRRRVGGWNPGKGR